MKQVIIQSPSNIALIKYMGKKDPVINLPENPSLSMTLKDLATRIQLLWDPYEKRVHQMQWEVFQDDDGWKTPVLSHKGRIRFETHFDRVIEWSRTHFGKFNLPYEKPFGITQIQSQNRFPQGVGIASSASSFSALTVASAMRSCADFSLFEETFRTNLKFRTALAEVSAIGSGSSSRSLIGPWVEWSGESVFKVDSKCEDWGDLVLLMSDTEKKVSSSQAHLRIKTSPLWKSRVSNVQKRLTKIKEYLQQSKVESISKIAWEEFHEMHQLFHTSSPSFSYWIDLTKEVLDFIENHPSRYRWVVTMDAGPNIHLLMPRSSMSEAKKIFKEKFPQIKQLIDFCGQGTEIISYEQDTRA
ncbi:MAG: hypothetical protein CL678_17875 [Bdellovibrionaceae bacterium]|nr:hypothetical protein [Pseudobdellovibrionaceae bacterium]|tara:strand:+ start:2339 stop:3409 length:1071 start_codon:yes stop_codon:yes gene_type:complete